MSLKKVPDRLRIQNAIGIGLTVGITKIIGTIGNSTGLAISLHSQIY